MAKNNVSVGEFMVQDSPFLGAVADSEREAGKSEGQEFSQDKELGDEDPDKENEEETDAGDEGDESGDADEDESELEEGESDEEGGEDEEEDSEAEEAKKDSQEEEVKAKTYTATLPDGSQVKMTDDTTFKMKVDGKFKRVSVKDLASDYNGRVKSDELIRRGSETQKQLQTQLDKATSESKRAKELTQAFIEGVTKGDIIEAMVIVNEMTGGDDPHKLLSEFLGGMGKAVDEIQNMTPEEIQKRANNYIAEAELKKKQKKLATLTKDEQVRAAKARKAELCEEFGLTDDDMNASYRALLDRNEELEDAGKDPIEFTLEDVAATALEYKDWVVFKEIEKEHEIEFQPGDVNNLIELAKVEVRKKGSRLEKKDYLRLVGNYANKELADLGRKVGSNKKTTPKGKKGKPGKGKVKDVTRLSQIWET